MTFTLGLLLIPYFIAVALFLVFATLNVYHLVHYGATTKVGFIFTFVFFAGTVVIAAATLWALSGTNWQQPISLSLFSQVSNTELPTF